jgi:hypothetical protein
VRGSPYLTPQRDRCQLFFLDGTRRRGRSPASVQCDDSSAKAYLVTFRRPAECGVSKNIWKRSQADKDDSDELFDTQAGPAVGVSSLPMSQLMVAYPPTSATLGDWQVPRITSSAWKSSDSRTVRPRVCAIVRLRTSLNLVGCSTGRTLGLTPGKIVSTEVAARRYMSGLLPPRTPGNSQRPPPLARPPRTLINSVGPQEASRCFSS